MLETIVTTIMGLILVASVLGIAYIVYQLSRLSPFGDYISEQISLASTNARAAIDRGEFDGTWEKYYTIDIEASYENFSKFSNSFSRDWANIVVHKTPHGV